MAIVFKHRYKSSSLIGTGTIKFRPYTVAEPLPQLSTPQNVSANGTTVSWDEVENATSYAVLADGSEIGTVEGAVTDELAGTWVFNDIIDYTSFIRITQETSILFNFTSNGNTYFGITTDFKPNGLFYIKSSNFDDFESVYVASTNTWTNEAYKTITIASKLSEVTNGDALLTWLQANATKQ